MLDQLSTKFSFKITNTICDIGFSCTHKVKNCNILLIRVFYSAPSSQNRRVNILIYSIFTTNKPLINLLFIQYYKSSTPYNLILISNQDNFPIFELKQG